MMAQKSLNEIAESLLDSLLAPSVAKTEGLGCDNMSLIIIAFCVGGGV